MSEYKKFIFPGILTALGLFLVINGASTEQNGAYMFGAIAFFLAGAISIVAALVQLTKSTRLIISGVLVVLVVGLSYADYMSIKVPIDFQKEKVKRYAHVIQRLKDIRTAELAYKSKFQKYTGNLDSLINFVKFDSIAFVKAIGEVPDTLTEDEALKRSLVTRDTNFVSVKDSLFKPTDDRVHAFVPDSLRFVPFTGGAQFKLEAGKVERSGIKVPVFQATDSKPFDPRDPMQVGSLSDPKTNGNWE